MILTDFITENESGIPVFNPVLKELKSFRKIIERDRGSSGDAQGRKKKRATAELAYIFFMNYFDSPYKRYDNYDKRSEVVREALGLPSEWTEDEVIKEGIKQFEDLQKTENSDLLEIANNAIDNLKNFLKTVDLSATDKNGKLKLAPKEYAATLEGVDKAIERLKKAKELVKSDLARKGSTARGGEEVNYFERRENLEN